MALKITALGSAEEVTHEMFADGDGVHPVRDGKPHPKDTFKLSFRPRFYTADYEERSAKLRAELGIGAATIQQFLAIITKTDLLGEDGKPLRLTEEGLKVVPTRTLNELIGGCLEAMQPDPTSSGS